MRESIPDSFGDDARVMTHAQLVRKYHVDGDKITEWRERLCAWNERSYDLRHAEMCLNCKKPRCGGWCNKVRGKR